MAYLCRCRKYIVQTAWTSINAGWRFVSCPDRVCNFFVWLELQLCDRALVIILGLIRRINMLEAQQGIERDRSVTTAATYVHFTTGRETEKKYCSKALFFLVLTWMWLLLSYICSHNGQAN
ncbi:hypothetical protein POM88_044407 [Heracleum sosnowskyi]|uniref:Uncharacterized protein n=1 Tax=Heracleum sosnowskyi TaxID=360622 RepID=A0AAD8H4C9_9APIA|nr:hypothetical protein POM88_044407 [Heracleum sosnowskyi]